MKHKILWFLSVLLLGAFLLPNCKKDEDKNLNDLAILSALTGGGDCSVAFPGKSAVAVNRTKTTAGGGAVNVIWGAIPVVNHPIAIVEALGVQIGDTITFTGVDVIDNPSVGGDNPTVYESADCPLPGSSIIDGFDNFSSSTRGGAGPYVWTNTTAGSYYFLLYIVGGSAPAATVEFAN